MADVKWIKIVTDIFDDEKVLLIESMPEADSLIVIWFKLLCLLKNTSNILGQSITNILSEGFEEGINVPLQGMIDKFTIDTEKAWTGKGGVFDKEAMGEAAKSGALLATLLGGAGFTSTISNTVVERKYIRSTVKALNETALMIPEEYRPQGLYCSNALYTWTQLPFLPLSS